MFFPLFPYGQSEIYYHQIFLELNIFIIYNKLLSLRIFPLYFLLFINNKKRQGSSFESVEGVQCFVYGQFVCYVYTHTKKTSSSLVNTVCFHKANPIC